VFWAPSPLVKWLRHEADLYSHLVPRLKMCRAILYFHRDESTITWRSKEREGKVDLKETENVSCSSGRIFVYWLTIRWKIMLNLNTEIRTWLFLSQTVLYSLSWTNVFVCASAVIISNPVVAFFFHELILRFAKIKCFRWLFCPTY
jgi:hypothetical protein